MTTSKLIFAEIRCRPVNFVLCVFAIVIAAALFISGPTLVEGYARDANEQLQQMQQDAEALHEQSQQLREEAEQMTEDMQRELADLDKKTKKIMRDLGVNLRIVHKDTNMTSLYTDFVAPEFPEEYVQRLAEAKSIETIVHLVATLQHKIKWNDRTALLVGTMPVLTQSQKNEEKPHMVKPVEQGTALVGHELGDRARRGSEYRRQRP